MIVSASSIHFRFFQLLFVMGLACLCLMGCDRSGKRLKEKPVHNPLVQKKPKVVQGHMLAGSKKALLRSAQLTPASAAHILKGFVYRSTVSYRFKRNSRILKLKEKVLLEQGAKGEFHLKVSNNHNKGYEVIWTNKRLYQRMRHRPFRVTSHNAEDAFVWQQRSFGRWRSIVTLYGSQLGLSSMGTTQKLGRTCHKYQITLYRDPQKPLKIKEGTAWSGKAPDHTRGAAAKKTRTPLAAKGVIWIDKTSGLPIKVKFSGRYRIGKPSDHAIATIQLDTEFTTAKSGPTPPPEKIVQVKQDVDAHNAFGLKKPTFMLPPPSVEEMKKKRKRKRRKKRR